MHANSLRRIERQLQTTSYATSLAYSRPFFFHTDTVRIWLLQRLRAIRLVMDLFRFPRVIKYLSSDRSWDNHWFVRVTQLQVLLIRTTKIFTLPSPGYHPSEIWSWARIQTQYLKLSGQREVWVQGMNGYPEEASVPSSPPVHSKSEKEEEHKSEYWNDPLVKLDNEGPPI